MYTPTNSHLLAIKKPHMKQGPYNDTINYILAKKLKTFLASRQENGPTVEKGVCLLVYCSRPTAQGHLRVCTKHAHYI